MNPYLGQAGWRGQRGRQVVTFGVATSLERAEAMADVLRTGQRADFACVVAK